MHVEFLTPARDELAEAVRFTTRKNKGWVRILSWKCNAQLDYSSFGGMAPLSKRTRRCRTNRFPYGVIYQVRGEALLIIAVMHLHRRPAV